MTDDKIIKFPGAKASKPADIIWCPTCGEAMSPPDACAKCGHEHQNPVTHADLVTDEPGNLFVPPQNIKLTKDQEKAIATVLSGTPFVCIGIRPVADGADFVTACAGDPTDLRNAQEHLPGVIQRLFERKGIL